MCTLTIIPISNIASGGVRIACNRDESRARPPALPPEVRMADGRQMIMPVDPVGGGTWIGVNDAGLAAALLNAYPADFNPASLPPAETLVSRGTIIPGLLGSNHFDELIERAARVDTSRFAPFRLVLVGDGEVVEMRWASHAMQRSSRVQLTGPMMFTSSGLGDEMVDGPRRELFRDWFHESADWPKEQDAFHRHQWPESPGVSVCMSRAEARTVSYTVVEITAATVTMAYHPQPPNQPSTAVVKSIALT